MNYQKTIVAGRLAHTPELKALPSGVKVATFSLAVNRVWYDNNDQKQEQTDWHNCIAYGRIAENLAQYAEGGQVLLVEGRNHTTSWEDKNGGPKRYKTEILVATFQFGQKSQARADRKAAEAGHDQSPKQEDIDTIEYPEEDINPEDIPF